MAINNVTLVGRLTSDPTFRKTSNDLAICNFVLAVDRETKGKTDFIPCTAWRQTAEFVNKYFTKGTMIAVIGRMENNPFQDKDGKKRDSWGINVQSVSFCGSRSETGEAKPTKVEWEEIEDDGQLPF